jgi:hypothetical protein
MPVSADSSRAFLHVDREEARLHAASIPAVLFQRRVPALHFGAASQELLRHALRGHTDDELGQLLGITTAAVKKRWMRIFEDVERCVPSFGNASLPGDTGRGPQRRHHLLAYIRDHPEELRPFCAAMRNAHADA